ncbi:MULTISPECIES: heteromeric transposase endonuclease subunit TnsA [unclassified Paraburkholderia]|uniref:heteromeric transposase endonuclease subunit TnsA n=1 Tax=unclassified Paraburkholderia TaxID=2615204 RepID=UPI002AB2054A|nr:MULTISPECIES: heteromeric transposase endonuclease subunit TnsA [unclassified Paraburkholderia]
MTARKSKIRKTTIERKLKEQALAKSKGVHQRWQHTRDRTGSGTKIRLACSKAASEEVHLLSAAEHAELLEGWYRREVKVIYDQVAIDREKTQRAAASINVVHPLCQSLGELAVISTSLVYITERGKSFIREARSVRSIRRGQEGELTRSQLIERKAWEDDGALYVAVTKSGMHANRSQNLAWIFRAHNDTVNRTLSGAEMAAQRQLLRLVRWKKEMRVIDACRLVDRTAGIPAGSGVRAFRQLAGARRLAFDLDVSNPLNIPLDEIWRPVP